MEGGAAASHIVADIMDSLGCTSDWASLNAKDDYLSQQHTILRMVCAKHDSLGLDMGSIDTHMATLRQTVAMVKQLAVPSHEPFGDCLV